jgi:hypothetical protein
MSRPPVELPDNMKGSPPQREEAFPPIGMGPAVWGPIFWTTMHIITIGYSSFPREEEKAAAINFFESLQYVIPCPICKEHYKANLKEFPVRDAVGDKQTLIRWLFNMHNTINQQLNKPKITWHEFIHSVVGLSKLSRFSFQEVSERPYFDTQSLLYLVAGIGLGVGGYLAYKHYK